MEGMKMAILMVDYENVWGTNGLKGVEYLTSEDILYIFYSQCCEKIRAEYMEAIRNSNCDFMIYKLRKTGKNALDFYIASQVGECCGKLQEAQIAIISNDKGFKAVADFWSLKEESKGKYVIVTAPTVERGILALNAASDKERRNFLMQKSQMLDLGQEHAKYLQKKAFRQKLENILSETEYEGMLEQVLEMLDEDKPIPRKMLYTGSLHSFGRKNGTKIYHLLKNVV
ncbi:MAG: PIN domain-containing protein [Lachnospiraceae bacterium]|nr:PIN domain-containing protein [Lachnospiraceae bacterium]